MKFPALIDNMDSIKALSFSGGRVSADLMSRGGLSKIRYYGRRHLEQEEIFCADTLFSWIEMFRHILSVDGDDYYVPLGPIEIFPFGYRTRSEIANVSCELELRPVSGTMPGTVR